MYISIPMLTYLLIKYRLDIDVAIFLRNRKSGIKASLHRTCINQLNRQTRHAMARIKQA